jgi:hypothetical protein
LVPRSRIPTLSPGLALVEQLAEHFHAGAGGLDGVLDADDFDFFADLDDAALDASGHHGAATGDGEHVFHGHQEGAVDGALGRGNVAVQGVGQLHDGLFAEGPCRLPWPAWPSRG